MGALTGAGKKGSKATKYKIMGDLKTGGEGGVKGNKIQNIGQSD